VLQNFISDSPWDEKPVIDKLQKEVIQLVGDKHNGSLHIIENSEGLNINVPKPS